MQVEASQGGVSRSSNRPLTLLLHKNQRLRLRIQDGDGDTASGIGKLAKLTTPTEALIYAIENDLAHVHKERMAQRKGEVSMRLREERAKVPWDAERIDELRQAMTQADRDKGDRSITEREVPESLRRQLKREHARSSR